MRSAFLPYSLKLRIFFSPLIEVINWLFDRCELAGLFDGHEFLRFIARKIPAGKENIEDLDIPFSAVVTDLLIGSASRITQGSLACRFMQVLPFRVCSNQ